MSDIRDALVRTVRRRYTTVDVPGVGAVRIQSLTEGERVKVVHGSADGEERATLILYSLVDDNGDRLFADTEIDLVKSFDAAATVAISDAAQAHCLTGGQPPKN